MENWQNKAIESSGIKVPDWGLESVQRKEETQVEEENGAVKKEIVPETQAQQDANIETVRAGIARISNSEQNPNQIIFINPEEDPLRFEILILKRNEYKERIKDIKELISNKGRAPEDTADLKYRLKEENYKLNILDNTLVNSLSEGNRSENMKEGLLGDEFDEQLFSEAFEHIKKYATEDLKEVGLSGYIERAVDSLEHSKDGLETRIKIIESKDFDELFHVLDSFGENIPSKSYGYIKTELQKQYINKYRSGELLVHTNDMLGGNPSDALKSITSTFGLRNKVYELLRKEGSGRFLKTDGSIE